jgi:hypothetical protein
VRVKFGRIELDVLSPAEAKKIIGDELDDRLDLNPTELVRAEESGVTSAAGALVLPVYVVPPAMEFRVHVVVIEADGFSPAVPFQGAGAFWRLRVSGRAVDLGSCVAGAPASIASQLPDRKTYGFMQGAVAVNQEAVEFELTAGPANTLVRVLAQGTLVTQPGTPPEK